MFSFILKNRPSVPKYLAKFSTTCLTSHLGCFCIYSKDLHHFGNGRPSGSKAEIRQSKLSHTRFPQTHSKARHCRRVAALTRLGNSTILSPLLLIRQRQSWPFRIWRLRQRRIKTPSGILPTTLYNTILSKRFITEATRHFKIVLFKTIYPWASLRVQKVKKKLAFLYPKEFFQPPNSAVFFISL